VHLIIRANKIVGLSFY